MPGSPLFSQKHSLLPAFLSQKVDNLSRFPKPPHLKQTWALMVANILAIGCLGSILVLMSKEQAHLILSIGITFCATSIVTFAGYICWKFIISGDYKNYIVESVDSFQMGVLLTNKSGDILYHSAFMKDHFNISDHTSLMTFTEEHLHKSMTGELVRLHRESKNQISASTIVQVLTKHNNSSYWRVTVHPLPKRHQNTCWLFHPLDLNQSYSPVSLGPLAITNFYTVFEHAPMGIVLLDSNGIIRASNQFFRQNLYGEEIFKETLFYNLIDKNSQQDIKDVLEQIILGNKVAMPMEVTFNNDFSEPVSAFASRLRNEKNEKEVIGIILHFFDNSEQKNLHLQLVQSQKMQAMGQLAGGIAHDFNNLLTAMIGFCDLLLLRHSPGDQSFIDIMQIKQNANRAANLVRQLLAFSKQQTLQPQIMDVAEILSELSVLLQRLVGVNIDLNIIHGRDLGFIKVDQGQFEQVIINLVVNARDAMNAEGILSISTFNKTINKPTQAHHESIPPGQYVVLVIEDSGSGIAPDHLSRIFDPFFSTKELGQGTGLGLSTVYGIVKQTGGYIIVDSKVNKGTKMSVIFPYHDSSEVKKTRQVDSKKSLTKDLTGKGTILFVEDEDAVRLFGARALRDKGYKVVEASGGEEALSYIQSLKHNSSDTLDLMVTDVVMPTMDGLELVKRVHEDLPSLKIIYISGYAEDSFRQKVGQDINIHFLPKPFSLKELALKVKNVMND